MKELKLSVVLCTYNGQAHLREQLDSLLAQTRLPDEVVVGDDHSVDASRDLLHEFALRARSLGVDVRLDCHPANLGFVCNFSDTLRQAFGDVLLLCDQDDVWHPEKLATIEARLRTEPEVLLLCSDARLVDAHGGDQGVMLFDALELTEAERLAVRDGRAFEVLLRRSMVTGATAALRRSLVDLALPVGAGWIHDEWLAIIASVVGRVGMIESALIDYRQHGNNQIGMRKRTMLDKWRDLLRPRGAQFQDEVHRLTALEAHLSSMEIRVEPSMLAAVAQKRRHFEERVALGRRARLARLPAVLREARVGNYWRYGTGMRSMLRDMLRHD